MKRKDPKKVRAGRLGGRKSGANFKHNKEAARVAGRRSAWLKNSGKLEDLPLEYEDIPMLSTSARRAAARAKKIQGGVRWPRMKSKK